ncbi:MAG: hypothetical protein HC842_00355 [Cytophagales bacterium]|nr:hypothetical protein [Cytophagales bacterium]
MVHRTSLQNPLRLIYLANTNPLCYAPKTLFSFLRLFFIWGAAGAQSVNAPLNPDQYHLIDRLEIKHGRQVEALHSSFKAYPRRSIAALVDSAWDDALQGTARDQFNAQYLANDNQEWSQHPQTERDRAILGAFYTRHTDVYSVSQSDFELHANPVLYGALGQSQAGAQTIDTYSNTRGLELRATVANKIGFYTFLGENQMRAPAYEQAFTREFRAVPREGFYKGFGDAKDAYDFFSARGYISFDPVPAYFNVQFGHDKFFIGNGQRSLLLSDHANSYLFMKWNTRVWKVNYTNLFAEMNGAAFGNASGSLDQRFPKKYLAMHHLSINMSKNFNLGLFEAIAMNGEDSLGAGSFEAGYLNPIIFYRAVEHQNGSQDNALIGLDWKWNFLKRFSFYGQVVLDELIVSNLVAQNGWWGNKYALQGGLKYIDAFWCAPP